MHASDVKDIKDLPRFFKDRSKNISKVFSDELININTIRSAKPKDEKGKEIEGIQEISFKLKLLTTTDKDAFDKFQLKVVINFFRICLHQNKNFIVDMGISQESEELYNKYCDAVAKEDRTVEGFIKSDPIQILLQGITIKLRVNIEDINLNNLHQLEADLEEKLKQAKNNEQSQVALQVAETQQETAQNTTNMQVVPVRDLFGLRVAKEINCRAPVVTAAIKTNMPKYGIFLPFSNFLDEITRLFFLKTRKLPTQKRKAITCHPEPQEVEQDKVAVRKPSQQRMNIPQNHNHIVTDAIQPTLIQKVENFLGVINDDDIQAQGIIKRAKNHAQVAIGLNEKKAKEKQKTLDEIFCETMTKYYDPQKKTIFYDQKKRTFFANTVFKTIFLKNIPEPDKISEEDVLNILKKFGLKFNKDDLITPIYEKKDSLLPYVRCTKIPVISNSIVQTILAPYELIKQHITIQKAQKKVQEAIKNNNDKTRDEIFIEVMQSYRDQDQATFSRIFDIVFNSVFCEGKTSDEIETCEEVFNILKILEVQFDAKYLKKRIDKKKQQLRDLAFSPKLQPSIQPEDSTHKSKDPSPAAKKAKTRLTTNTAFKSSLKTVFSSKETYFCLFVIGASISILCLWHFPLGKVSILQGLVPEKKEKVLG